MNAQAGPTAAVSFGFRDYLEALAHLPLQAARPLSLRLHFPAFDGDEGADMALLTYLSYLKREAAMHAVLFTGMSTVVQLGFDGMAPSCLADRQLGGLLAHLREHFRFMPDEAGDYEVAVDQAAPAGRLVRLRQLGFNRLRIELRGDGDNTGQLPTLVQGARRAGFRSVMVGLAYGAPGQDFAGVRRMLDLTLAAAPDRVVLCHRPGKGCDEADIPAGGVAQRMQQLCADRLDMAGYTALGAGRFAQSHGGPAGTPASEGAGEPQLPGTFLVGCGVGALGAVGQVRWQNVAPLSDYYALLDRNQVPVGARARAIAKKPDSSVFDASQGFPRH